MPLPCWFEDVAETLRAECSRELQLLIAYASQTKRSPETPFSKTLLGREIDQCARVEPLLLARALMAAIDACECVRDEKPRASFLHALAGLLRRNIPLTQIDITSLLLV